MSTGPRRPCCGPTSLVRGECHVWWAWSSSFPPGLWSLCDRGERARAAQFVYARDRMQYLAAHSLARIVVGTHLGREPASVRFVARCKSCGGPHGKPHLDEPGADLEVSLSHSGTRIVVAVARGVPVGVDVEQTSPPAGGALPAEVMLSSRERQVWEGLSRPDREPALLRYWVRKEAVLKATGDGLAVSPGLLTVSGPDEPARLLDWAGPGPSPVGAIGLHDLDPGPGFAACLALLAGVPHRVVQHEAAVEVPAGQWMGRVLG